MPLRSLPEELRHSGLCYFNWGTKHIGLGPKVDLTDDAKADTEKIQALYEEMHLVGKHPKNYITH